MHTEGQEQTTYSEGNMAREPERKLVDRTFRCIDEDFLFPGRPNQSRANCPHEPTHSIELVEE